jgi:hypothetical protein
LTELIFPVGNPLPSGLKGTKPIPKASAVSKNVTPRSSARRMSLGADSRSCRLMRPSLMAETSRPLAPGVRVFLVVRDGEGAGTDGDGGAVPVADIRDDVPELPDVLPEPLSTPTSSCAVRRR